MQLQGPGLYSMHATGRNFHLKESQLPGHRPLKPDASKPAAEMPSSDSPNSAQAHLPNPGELHREKMGREAMNNALQRLGAPIKHWLLSEDRIASIE